MRVIGLGARLRLLEGRLLRLEQVDVLGELVEVGGPALVHLLHALHVLVQAAKLGRSIVVEELRELGLPRVWQWGG